MFALKLVSLIQSQIQWVMMRLQNLYIDNTAVKGRGVFTNEAIAADTVIEIAPVIVMNSAEREHLDQTLLHDYIFEWGDDRKQCALALGWVSIYNHSYQSNCEYLMDFEEQGMIIKTVKNISEGEELTINYNGEFNDGKKVWFEVN
jgi:uncharacterized protein